MRDRRPGAGFAGALLLTAVLLSSCAQAHPARTTEPVASPHPSPSARVDLTEPASLLPATCDGFVPDPASVAGRPVAADPVVLRPDARQSGDLLCSWKPVSAVDGFSLSLEVRRHGAVLAADPLGWWTPQGTPAGVGADSSALACVDQPSAGGSCTVKARVGDYWLDLELITPATISASAQRTEIVSAASSIVTRLRDDAVPADWSPPTGAWASAIDCAGLAAPGDVASALGVPSVQASDSTRSGEDFELSDAVARLGGRSACAWKTDPDSTDYRQVVATLIRGGGWSLTRVPTGESAIAVPGADLATIACSDTGGSCAIRARIGVNLVIVASGLVDFPDGEPSRDQLVSAAGLVVSGLARVPVSG